MFYILSIHALRKLIIATTRDAAEDEDIEAPIETVNAYESHAQAYEKHTKFSCNCFTRSLTRLLTNRTCTRRSLTHLPCIRTRTRSGHPLHPLLAAATATTDEAIHRLPKVVYELRPTVVYGPGGVRQTVGQ